MNKIFSGIPSRLRNSNSQESSLTHTVLVSLEIVKSIFTELFWSSESFIFSVLFSKSSSLILDAILLTEFQQDATTLSAALLHDVVEDTGVALETLEKTFGKEIAQLVDGVSKLTNIHFSSKVESQVENFRKMFMAMAKDIRVMIIKLCDRLHNMRTMQHMAFEKRRRIAYERLLLEAINNNSTLFVHRDESEAAWRWIDGIIDGWKRTGMAPRPYQAGTWGPPSALHIPEHNGHSWYE